MTPRIRELLEEAVSDLEPRALDPAPTVVRRARRARMATVAASTLTVAALAGGVVLSGQLFAGGLPSDGTAGQPPTPRVVDGKIVAGSVTLPIPKGWKVFEQTGWPSGPPSAGPSIDPSSGPTGDPSSGPTGDPSSGPTADPSSGPTGDPSSEPTADPSSGPTGDPSGGGTADPSVGGADDAFAPYADPSSGSPCGWMRNTVVIGGPGYGCGISSVEVYGTTRTAPGGIGVRPLPGREMTVATGPMITLAGGEPGWLLSRPVDSVSLGNPDFADNDLFLPWSKLMIKLRGGAAEQQRIIDSIRTDPGPGKRLDLPETVRSAELQVPTDRISHDGAGETADPATLASVLRLLGEQQPVLDPERACASQDVATGHLTLNIVDAAPSPSHPPVMPDPADSVHVMIALGDGCREAVSSAGGRVTLTAEAVAELKRLFGIPAR